MLFWGCQKMDSSTQRGLPGSTWGEPGSRRGRSGGSPALRVSYLKAITAVQGAIQSDGLNWDLVLFVTS